MSLEILFGGIYAAWGVVAVWSFGQLKGFVQETPSIADEMCLERFRALVRVQMRLALVVIGLLAVGMIIGLLLIARHGLVGLVVVLGANAFVIASALYVRTVEVKARSLQAGSEALGDQYRRISETWVKKPLPDF